MFENKEGMCNAEITASKPLADITGTSTIATRALSWVSKQIKHKDS